MPLTIIDHAHGRPPGRPRGGGARRRLRAVFPGIAVGCLAIALLPAVEGATENTSSAASPAAGMTWTVQSMPFQLTFHQGGRTVAAEAGGDIAGPGGSLAYQVGGTASSREGATYHQVTDLISRYDVPGGTEYLVATDEPDRTATVTVTHTHEGARVRWTFTPATGVTAVFEAMAAKDTEHYLSGSSATSVDVRGQIRGWSPGKEGNEAGDYCQNQEQTASPFYLSSGGYGLLAETDAIGRFAFPGAAPVKDGPNCGKTPRTPSGAPTPYPCPVANTAQPDRVQVCVKDDELTYDVFAGTPAQVTEHYYQTVGLPSLPPPTQFAVMKWRDVNANQQEVVNDVAEFKKLGIPIGTIWIDNPWEVQPPGNTTRANGSACNGSFRFDPTFFPDPKKMIDTIHAEGVKFGLWVSPLVNDNPKGGGSCADLNGVWRDNDWIIPGTGYIDFTIPAAREYYVRQLTKLFSLGVDMTKEDRGEEIRLETGQLAGGSGAKLYLRYPDLFQSAVSEALRNVNGDDFETLVRAGAPGTAQHTHGIWGSDATQTFGSLRTELHYGIGESLTGHFAWGSDTGGIDPQKPANATNSPTPALLTRWAQFSAVSPVFEVGGAGLNATPWVYDTATVNRFRDAAVLHTELFPYLYGLAEQAARTGVPIMRAVGYQYPDDEQAWAQGDQELMVGPDLLAAPVTSDAAEADGAAGRPTDVNVYLPAGQWIDVFTGAQVQGGQTITRSSSLDDFPLYLRAGSALGFNLRTPDIWSTGWGVDDLNHAGRSAFLVAPSDGTDSHIRAITSDQARLDARSQGSTLTLDVADAPAETQIVVMGSHAPSAVTLDGHPLAHATSTDALRGMTQGWTTSTGPFGGIVLKLAPSHGRAHVRLAW
ncbi:TIM-barrel domain-containing protein [Micromonospora sp. SL1-18]|uniref:TIM-barrel domain-containing protein n=1 Tax=Micromonospora sp. SL1-18 TaxID=3399128 RepID=UPI003A4E276E